MNKKLTAFFNVAAFLFVIIMNYVAVSLPLNNKTTGQLSDEYPNLFTPAGFTFSIWGIIYFFLGGFIIYQAIQLFKDGPSEKSILTITPLFIINCLANGSWLFAWHYEMVSVSVLIMLVMLSTLIAIHNKLKLALPWTFKGVKWWMDVPFSLYLGWISIATIANVTVLFVNMGLVPPGLSPLYWTILMIIIGALLALLMIFRRNNVVYAFVAIWAFYGILSKRSAIGDAESNKLVIVCWVAIAVISISVIINVFSRKRSSNTSPAIL